MTGMTLGAMAGRARAELAEAGIIDSALDARLLVEHFSGAARGDAILHPQRLLSPQNIEAIAAALARRKRGESVHRIMGYREFHGLRLELSPQTLEPRPDTEALVDTMLPFLKASAGNGRTCRILDLGTGTGAIALALLKEMPQAEAIGADISPEALATATANARNLGLASRFQPLLSDWFSAVNEKFNGIVANPPYIRSRDLDHLQAEVRLFDPARALDGGADGLDAYRIIAAGCSGHLDIDGCIGVEIGAGQKDAVIDVFCAEGLRKIAATKDLGGNDRALVFSL